MADLRHLLAIYVHAHQTGNSVPPHINAEARAALAAEPTFIASEPSDEDLEDLAEVFNGDPLPAMRRALELWGRPTVAALAAEPPESAEPDTDAVLTLAHLRRCPAHGQLPANAWACPECLRELREELARFKAPAADGERDHVPDAGNMVAADEEREEREELARWLEFEADNAQELGCATIYDHDRLRWAAGYLRQLPPEGLEAIRYCVEEDGAVIQRTLRAPESWAIRAGSSCMSTTGEWDIEPMPSERTDEWLANHRWPSAAAAWEALQQARRREVGDE